MMPLGVQPETDSEQDDVELTPEVVDDEVERRAKRFKETIAVKVLGNIAKAQVEQKKQYDLRRRAQLVSVIAICSKGYFC